MMKFSDLLSSATDTCRGARLRTVLTLLGIAIGIAALIGGLSILEGANQRIGRIVAGYGGKFMVITPNENLRRLGADNFNLDDARAIAKVSGVTMLSLQKSADWIPVKYQNRGIQTDIFGTDPNFALIRNRKVDKGRFLDASDLQGSRRVCVITEGIRQLFFPAGDCLEQTLEINGILFEIVGCLAPQLIPAVLGEANHEEGTIFIPLTTSQSLLNRYDYDQILLSYGKDYESKKQIKLLKGRIESILKFRHGPDKVYLLKTMDENVEQQKNLTLLITISLCCVAFLCLLVGGIGITNIMIINVMERYREIGIRKALGAHNREISSPILLEAVMIATVGGGAGLVLGIIAARLVAIFAGLPSNVTWWVLLLGIGLTFMVGIASGLFPAQKAASLEPVECLRYE